ncbi:hypothetical protein PAXINDRAFT_15830 [Paxillus involutus ATCC 200175]|uniref:Uncharacterized protein n=1 Tax=Paxillus involutus ATCC 200175 TaxID=664439 RepID=A0A0C9SSJ5_PAXIN|nr:hypothetical protein PAXINDRAFT_15830 [Paxillus involutus ATCC 200175]
MDSNSSPYTPQQYIRVAAFMQTQFGGPWNHHQIATASQQGFNGNWGPEDIIMMESFARHSVYSGMNHPAHAAMTTSGYAPHTGFHRFDWLRMRVAREAFALWGAV